METVVLVKLVEYIRSLSKYAFLCLAVLRLLRFALFLVFAMYSSMVSILGALVFASVSSGNSPASPAHQLVQRDQGVCRIVKPMGCYIGTPFWFPAANNSVMALPLCSSACPAYSYFGVSNGDEVSNWRSQFEEA